MPLPLNIRFNLTIVEALDYATMMDVLLILIYLATEAASKKWTMPIRDWKPALNRFMIEFEEQLAPHI